MFHVATRKPDTTVLTCEGAQAYCANNMECYSKSGRCDGAFDCRDHSDEKNCQGHLHTTPKRMYDLFSLIWLLWNSLCKSLFWEKLQSHTFFWSVTVALAGLQNIYMSILRNRKTLLKVVDNSTKLICGMLCWISSKLIIKPVFVLVSWLLNLDSIH